MIEFLAMLGEDNGITPKYIIGALSGVIVAMATFIIRLYSQINSIQEDRLKELQSHFDLLKTLRNELDK